VLAAKHKVHPNRVSTWKRRAVDGMADVFSGGGKPTGPSEAMSSSKKRSTTKGDHPKLSIVLQCKLVRLNRSAFSYAPVRIDAATLEMMKEIDQVFTNFAVHVLDVTGPRRLKPKNSL